MSFLKLFTINRTRLTAGFAVFIRVLVVASVALAAPGGVVNTPTVPSELPVEIETELGPGSLKQAPLWKETIQLLQDPYGTVERRPGFGVTMPPLNVMPLNLNFLTDQPLRLRTSDGEVSWDQPGPLFDPAQTVASLDTDGNGTPDLLRTRIGALVASEDAILDQADMDRLGNLTSEIVFCAECGYLIVSNPTGHPAIPPEGTVVAVPAYFDGMLHELEFDADGNWTGEYEEITELSTPINEEDFFRPATDTAGVPAVFQPYIGRLGAEVLGKALFWDMQVGSDGVQSCGTCHFSAGADIRTKNMLNPNHLGNDTSLEIAGPNEDVTASDFPFHKLANTDIVGEPLLNPGNVTSDSNDVMSSMGVRFRQFTNIPAIGAASFGPASFGIRPLNPDLGTAVADPIPVFQGLRRVEPRNTPTMISAAFNMDNFWDGRARFIFNGGSVFGAADPQSHIFIDPGVPGNIGGPLQGATNGHINPDLVVDNPDIAGQPVRIKFSSLASQATGPVLSDFEMSFAGRNWAKVGKKLLQNQVTPLANQLVAVDDSRLGPFSNQGGSACAILGRATSANRPGICVSYTELIQLSFDRHLWQNTNQHLNGASAVCTSAVNGVLTPPNCDPFDGYRLTLAGGAASPTNRDQFRQVEANFSMFFGLSAQAYEQLLIPDDTPFDQFMDANPQAANAVAQPGEQGTLPPSEVAGLVGTLTLIPDDPSTPYYDGFGPDEIYGFDIFAGANLTAALPVGSARNPDGVGSNPFLRTARCMLCHIGPEQTDHSVNISHGLLKGGAEYELPLPYLSPEPTGAFNFVPGLILEEELAETPQDVIEVEPRDMAMVDDPATAWDESVIAVPSAFAFGDQGVYNIGLRPVSNDIGRGGTDAFGWPLQLGALALKNIGGPNFEPCDTPGDSCTGEMSNFDPDLGPAGGLFEESGDGATFPGTSYTLQSINPGYDKTPTDPLLPAYMAPWVSDLPAGELHPQIDELGFTPNTITENLGGPAIEYGELLYGSDLHCAVWSGNLDPAILDLDGNSAAANPRWGALDLTLAVDGVFRDDLCANLQSDVAGNLEDTLHGTWPFANRVGRDGAFKAPQLRNVELTGPYFHTGSYLTLRQVVDFYLRGGDFPVTNAEVRDQHIIDATNQVFAFGATTVADDPNYAQFAGGLPDTVTRYDAMPDTDQATPEYATIEDASVSLVKYLLSLTDQRVKYEQAPFDHPEIFVPLDGTAPDNTFGRSGFLSRLSGVCPGGTGPCFLRVLATGAGGKVTPVPAFMNLSITPVAGPNNDFFDR